MAASRSVAKSTGKEMVVHIKTSNPSMMKNVIVHASESVKDLKEKAKLTDKDGNRLLFGGNDVWLDSGIWNCILF